MNFFGGIRQDLIFLIGHHDLVADADSVQIAEHADAVVGIDDGVTAFRWSRAATQEVSLMVGRLPQAINDLALYYRQTDHGSRNGDGDGFRSSEVELGGHSWGDFERQNGLLIEPPANTGGNQADAQQHDEQPRQQLQPGRGGGSLADTTFARGRFFGWYRFFKS